MVKFIIIAFLLWRFLLFIPLFAGDKLIEYRTGYDYTNIWKFTEKYAPVNHPLIYPWSNFDGVHYLSIASNGYRDNERFFPLYPALIKLFSFGQPAFSTVPFFAGFLISNLSFLLALLLLYKLLRLDYKNNVVITIIIAILLFPTSFFFVSIYSESLFLLLTILSFYFIRKKQQFFISSVSLSFAELARIIGIAILPALYFERRKISVLFLPILTFLIFLLYNFASFGNAFQFLISQQELANSRTLFVFPLQTVYRYINILSSVAHSQYEWGLAFFELLTFFVVSVLLFIAWKKRVRTSYLIFALISFLIPVFSGTFSGLARYVIIIFPIFIALALVKSKIVKILYFIISPILLFFLLMLFSRGYFVA